MGFYLTISLATIVVILLTIRIWVKTHSVAFLAGIVFLYYWSLYGAWAVIWSGGELDNYLMHKLFAIALDADYFHALVLYTIFVVTIQLTILWRARPVALKSLPPALQISHYRIIVVSALAAGFAYLLVRDTISFGTAMTGAGYKAIREAPLFTLYQLFLNLAMLPLSLGMAVYFCGKEAKYLVGRSTVLAFFGYAVVLGGQLLFCMIVGNRSEVMICFVAMGLFYLANAKRPRKALVVALGAVGAAALTMVKMWRDHTFVGLSMNSLGPAMKEFIGNFAGSTEALSAHFSLYGVLHKNIPITGGQSFVSLVCSVIPRAFWPDRPDPVYTYYARSVGAMEGQGYTIHHATAWYLNFGTAGLVLGAIALGVLWTELYNRFERAHTRPAGLSRLYASIGFWTLTAALPAILRDGPETLKSIVIDYSLVPLMMLVFASSTLVLRGNRPSVVLARPLRPGRHAVSVTR